MLVRDTPAVQCRGQRLFIELRLAPRPGEAPDIDDQRDTVRAQHLDEIVERARRVSDRQDHDVCLPGSRCARQPDPVHATGSRAKQGVRRYAPDSSRSLRSYCSILNLRLRRTEPPPSAASSITMPAHVYALSATPVFGRIVLPWTVVVGWV